MCEGIFKKTPTNTMTAMNVRNANILLQLEMDNINPPRSGANIEIIPFTTIKDAKNLANALPSYLSPTEALAMTIAPPLVNP